MSARCASKLLMQHNKYYETMARKEINVFGTSFLDLLSGALAAVIILFVIVPKMSAADQEALREIEEAHAEVTELAEMIQQIENFIPHEQYEAIMQQIEELQHTIDELSEQVAAMQQQMEQTRQENEQLRQQIEQQRQQIAELEEQLSRQSSGQSGKIFGIDAEVGIVCQWHENIDVDLYVINLINNDTCYYHHSGTSFGDLNEDITSHSDGDDRYELFYQQHPIPGRYRIAVNIYQGASLDHASSAHVEGYIILFPGMRNEKKIPYGPITLTTPGQFVNIGTLIITDNNITLQR